MINRFTVHIDTREQNPWYWNESDFCEGYIKEVLPVGDYSLVGYEDILTVERKATTSEWAQNITDKRFDRELEKLDKYKYAFIVCEFGMEDILQFPVNSGIPPKLLDRVQVSADFLLKRTLEIQIDYNVKFFFAGSKVNAWRITNSLFKRVSQKEQI